MRKRSLLSLFLLIGLLQPALAQKPDSKTSRYIVAIGAYSPQSVYLLGKTPDTRTVFTYLGVGKQIESPLSAFTLYRTFGIIPYIKYNYSKRDRNGNPDLASGYGISPLGFEFLRSINSRTLVNTGISSGIIFMNKFFPTDKARRLNYSFDLSLSLQRFISSSTSISLGYRFHHISNAQTGKQNPGIDSNFIFFTLKHHSNGYKSNY